MLRASNPEAAVLERNASRLFHCTRITAIGGSESNIPGYLSSLKVLDRAMSRKREDESEP